jgi:hypothetical protein
MSTERDIRDFIFDMRDSISDIQSFVLHMNFADFVSDRKTVNAVIRLSFASTKGSHKRETMSGSKNLYFKT